MFKSLAYFEIDQFQVFVDITLFTFNFGRHGLSAVHWQQTI